MSEGNKVFSKIDFGGENIGTKYENSYSGFKVAEKSSNLPAKQSSFFTKLKNVLFYEIKP